MSKNGNGKKKYFAVQRLSIKKGETIEPGNAITCDEAQGKKLVAKGLATTDARQASRLVQANEEAEKITAGVEEESSDEDTDDEDTDESDEGDSEEGEQETAPPAPTKKATKPPVKKGKGK